MSKNRFKNLIRENQRLNNIRMNIRLASQSIENTESTNKNKKSKNIKKMKNKAIVAMAVAKGQESTEAKEIKRYIGVASCKVLGICPTKEALETIYGRTSENAPNYTSESEVNGIKVPQARIDIFFKLDDKYVDENGKHIDTVFKKSIFITKVKTANRDNTKFKVADKYGRTAWVTEAQLANHEIPQYSNGPANIDKDYRVLYRNEELLNDFLIAFLNIPSVQRYNNETKTWSLIEDPSIAEVQLDEIDKYFAGNFKELHEIYSYRPENRVKVLFGVKTVDGKTYQDIYDMFLKNGVNNYTKLEANVKERKDNGAYPNTEFKVCEFREYTVNATDFNTTSATAKNPFENTDDIF